MKISEKEFCVNNVDFAHYLESRNDSIFASKRHPTRMYFLYKKDLQDEKTLNKDIEMILEELKSFVKKESIQINKQEGIIVIQCDKWKNIYSFNKKAFLA